MTRRKAVDWSGASLVSQDAIEQILDSVLSAYRIGTVERLCRERPFAARWCLRRFAAPVFWFDTATADVGPTKSNLAGSIEIVLRWCLAQLRPDAAPELTPIPRHAWLGATPWRPMLAVACHYGLLSVPPFPERYRARHDEPAFEQLGALWEIAPSSFYRYVERGRQLLAIELTLPLTAERSLSLASFACEASYSLFGLNDIAAQSRWHKKSAEALLRHNIAMSTAGALWHTVKAGDLEGVLWQLEHRSSHLAGAASTDRLVASFNASESNQAQQLALVLAKSNLARVRGNTQEEQIQLAHGLRIAAELADPVWLGTVYSARGRFYEARDIDRAFADYREAADYFESSLSDETCAKPQAQYGLLRVLIDTAWLYILRNDPRAEAILERADAVMGSSDAPIDLKAKLEKTHGEFLHRQGKLDLAIDRTLHAAQLYERSGHQHQLVRAWASLAMLYGQLRDIDHALQYVQQVHSFSAAAQLDPETLAAIELNLGVAYFWQDRLDDAIDHYERAVQIALSGGLQTVVGKAHFNLAEAHFTQFQRTGAVDHEMRGDAYARSAISIWDKDKDAAASEATRNLKSAVLGEREHLIYERMLPAELAIHFNDMKIVESRRKLLESTDTVRDRIDARLDIAQAYLRIAVQEREAALTLIRQHEMRDEFDAKVQKLRGTFDLALSREEQLVYRWIEMRTVPTEHVPAIVRQLLEEHSLTKSTCSKVCAVSPATASKYLSDLCDAGLLKRLGNGPATRYEAV
jgi:tetratricopeptide (TPR) repeat protein